MKKQSRSIPKKLYQFKITLKGVKPAVWRRFAMSAEMSLHDASMVILAVMGWTNSHLHAFRIEGNEYGMPDPDIDFDKDIIDDRNVAINAVLKQGQTFEYIYDFGDNWVHELVVEKVFNADPKAKYPVCLEGERACPPEDCGGPWGYEELLEALADPRHERHDELSEWIGGSFDAEEFDVKETNRRIRKLDYIQTKTIFCPDSC